VGETGSPEMSINTKYKDREVKLSMDNIKASAEKIIGTPIPLKTDTEVVAPSGDKRDFVSLSRYWYRTEGGELKEKDGIKNPETENYPDSEKLNRVVNNILVASFAAESAVNQEEKEKFARHAVAALKAWFVNEETRMTPNFEYAAMKPGETTGNFWGIIEGVGLIRAIGGTNKLKNMGLIDAQTLEGVENWFNQYLNWLLTSEKAIGKKDANNEKERNGEKGMFNNHGTFYDVQVAYIADFLGKSEIARETIEGVKERIKSQINSTGEMPEESKRQGGMEYDYQLFNLYAFAELALLGQKYEVDLWHWQTEDGRSLQKAFEYFDNQLKKAGAEPFKEERSGELYFTFRAASSAYGNEDYWNLPSWYYENQLAEEVSAIMFRR